MSPDVQKATVFLVPAAGTATFAAVTEVQLSYRVQHSLKRMQEINGEDMQCHFNEEILLLRYRFDCLYHSDLQPRVDLTQIV